MVNIGRRRQLHVPCCYRPVTPRQQCNRRKVFNGRYKALNKKRGLVTLEYGRVVFTLEHLEQLGELCRREIDGVNQFFEAVDFILMRLSISVSEIGHGGDEHEFLLIIEAAVNNCSDFLFGGLFQITDTHLQ